MKRIRGIDAVMKRKKVSKELTMVEMTEKEKGELLLRGFTRLVDLVERYVIVQETNLALSRDRVEHLKKVEERNAKSGEEMAKMNFKAKVEHTTEPTRV